MLLFFVDLFNNEKPLVKSQYFSEDEDGMLCICVQQCEEIEYDGIDITTIQRTQ